MLPKLTRFLSNLLTKHPKSVGETYGEHFRFACFSGLRLIFAGFACVIHSILPFLFPTQASRTMEKIHQEIATRQSKKS